MFYIRALGTIHKTNWINFYEGTLKLLEKFKNELMKKKIVYFAC